MIKKAGFRTPPARRTPGYFWTLSEKLEVPHLRKQLEDMAAKGARSVCLHPLPPEFRPDIFSRMSPRYLSEEYNAIIAQVVAICAELKMKFFLYDEGGWPSGSACGQVVRSDPEKFAPKFAVYDGENSYKIISTAVTPGGAARMPNVLAPGATEKFLELTHEAFKRHFGKHFGKTVHIAFTDEPTMPGSNRERLAWVDDLPEEFIKRKGYDLRPYLGRLLDPAQDTNFTLRNNSELAEVRTDYCEVIGELFKERYLLPIRNWCRKNKIRSGGHFGGEDMWYNFSRNSFGNLLTSLRALDCPGVDTIWRQLHRTGRQHPFPKLASSAAHLNGNKDVLAEVFAIYGSGITPEEMKFVLDYMMVCGVNTFVFSALAQNSNIIYGGRPGFGESSPLWKYFGEIHTYTGRMAHLTSLGRPGAKTALFFDMRSLYLECHDRFYSTYEQISVADRLRRSQRDFEYISDDEVKEAKLRGGELKIGKMSFTSVVLPRLCRLSKAVRAKLEQLRAAGFPVLEAEELERAEVTLHAAPASWNLLVNKRLLGNGEALYTVMNTSGKQVSAQFTAAEKRPVAYADAVKGEFFAVPGGDDGVWSWDFAPYEARVFIVGEAEVSPAPAVMQSVVKTLDRWQLAPVVRYDGFDASCQPVSASAVPVKLGNWQEVLGADFSGDACYSTSFRHDGSEVGFLDLGEVKYACEVRLNGKSLGMKMLPPFVFDVHDKLHCGINRLEVVVTNTLSNAITPEVEQQWAETFPASAYHTVQREFEKESRESGLYGPVRICK